MQIGLKETKRQIQLDEKGYKRNMRLLTGGVVLLLLVSLCVQTVGRGLNAPMDVLQAYKTWIHLSLAEQFNWPIYLQKSSIIDEIPIYYDAVNRLKITAITFACGAMLAMSGALFQSVFRNPMAAPTMLGINTGVNLGILFLVLNYGGRALFMPFQKYVYCYICAAIMLLLVLGAGKLSSGKKKFSVFDLLIVGAILSQIAGAVRSYATFNMSNEMVLILNQVTNAIRVNVENVSFLFLGGVLIICLVPSYLIRFSFNAVCFENDQSKSFGIRTGAMKLFALVIGSIMATAAVAHCGTVGMISLIAPFISRAIFGADFRRLFWGNLLMGGAMLVVCRDIAAMIYFITQGLPLGIIVDFVAVPIFTAILVMQRRVWE